MEKVENKVKTSEIEAKFIPYTTKEEYLATLKGYPAREIHGLIRKHVASLERHIENQEQKIADNNEYLKLNKNLPEEFIEFRENENARANEKIKATKAWIKEVTKK